MFFFESDDEAAKRKTLADRASYVRRGGSLYHLKPEDVVELQTYALDIKDIQLYDYLDKFWCGKKSEVRP